MKKIYLFLILSLGFGSLCAQNAKIEKKDDSKEKASSVSITQEKTKVQTTTAAKSAAVSKDENGSNETIKENKKVDSKQVISKDDFEKQSERGKEYILAQPELFSVEE